MQVLKKGRDRNLGRKLTCSNCAALLLVLPCDVHSSSGYYMGELDTSYYVVCPECRKHTDVGSEFKTLPRHCNDDWKLE